MDITPKYSLVQKTICKALKIREELIINPETKEFLDISLDWIPSPFMGRKQIKYIILGQDPTVSTPETRKNIRTCMMMDVNGNLFNYITKELGFNQDNLYVTNIWKCFFIKEPVKIDNLLNNHLKYWLPLVLEEINYFPDAKIFTLGQPLLKSIIINSCNNLNEVKYYLGYDYKIKNCVKGSIFRYCNDENNILKRKLYPLPHQPSYHYDFYKNTVKNYINWAKRNNEKPN